MVLLYSLPYLSPHYRLEVKPRITPYVLPLTQVALTGSLYIVVMVSLERYLNIFKPFNLRHVVIIDIGSDLLIKATKLF